MLLYYNLVSIFFWWAVKLLFKCLAEIADIAEAGSFAYFRYTQLGIL